MKTNAKKTAAINFLAIVCFSFLILIMQTGCKHIIPKWETYITTDSVYINPYGAADTNQLIVWRTPGSDPSFLNSWLDSIRVNCGKIIIKAFCLSCSDSSLLLLSGKGVVTYIEGNGGTQGGSNPCSNPPNSNCGPNGNGDTIYWCRNFPVDVSDSSVGLNKDIDTLPAFASPAPAGPPVTVAVFDTGVDSLELKNSGYLYQSTNPSCLNANATNGWNFAGWTPAVHDDYIAPNEHREHGAIVSKLIVEQVRRYKQNSVRILPVKTHDSRGQCDLFSILCGFAYAKERGAQIINASFGYYSPKRLSVTGAPLEDPSALLFKKFIQYYLTNNNILLIAAAGNKNDALEKSAFTSVGLTPPTNLQDLDNVYFYPASFAADPDMPNVIAVTTVDTVSNTVSPFENYSSNVVDIGVNRDSIIAGDYYFENPRVLYNQGYTRGSSFATPIVTGIICAHYNSIKNDLATKGLPFTKQNILNDLLVQPIGYVTTLDSKIKMGVMKNNALRLYDGPLP